MTSLKRKGETVFEVEKDYLSITPLGSGNEVGRSCHILNFKGKTIMLDCGIHPAYTGIAALPFLDEIEPAEIDLLLISHFHLDHAAALPYFLEKTDFKGRVFMTHPTKSIYKLILQDYVKVTTISVEETLYDEHDLQASMDKIEVLNYHQTMHHKGIKFWCYNAGHVLGAAMFMIEIAGVKILYTGDYSRREDRHLMAAEIPDVKPDILIIEATYGVQTLEPVKERERRLTELVDDIVRRGGRCLIPVFALGRAQELLLILDEYWENNRSLQSIPIYYASALAKKCMTVYQTYINMMNRNIQMQAQDETNPFIFRHVMPLKGMDYFDDSGPCVLMASPGMLQNGLSRELFELWCSDKRNGVIIPGYCVEGTLAKQIMAEPSHITTMSGLKVRLEMSVHYVSFSAHADFQETSSFIDTLKPPHVILVHGEAGEMNRLKVTLQRKYLARSQQEKGASKKKIIQISTPRNCQTVELEFRAQKIAKIVGGLAAKAPAAGDAVSGLIVRKDFNYHIMNAEDLSKHTPLASTNVQQSLKVPFILSFNTLCHFLGELYKLEFKSDEQNSNGDGRTDKDADMAKSQDKDKRRKCKKGKGRTEHCVIVHKVVSCTLLKKPSAHVQLEWESNPVNDMIADSVTALLLSLQANPGAAKAVGVSHSCRNTKPKRVGSGIEWFLHEQFGDKYVFKHPHPLPRGHNPNDEPPPDRWRVQFNQHQGLADSGSMNITSANTSMHERRERERKKLARQKAKKEKDENKDKHVEDEQNAMHGEDEDEEDEEANFYDRLHHVLVRSTACLQPL